MNRIKQLKKKVVVINESGMYRMIESFKDLWDCVEKVNAHFVVED